MATAITDDEKKKKNSNGNGNGNGNGGSLYPYNMPSKNIYAGAGKLSSAPENTPLPGSITGGGAPSTRAATQPPAPPMPAPPSKPRPLEPTPNVMNVLNGAADDVSDAWNNGQKWQAVGAGVRGFLAGVPAVAVDAAQKFSPIIDGARGFGRGLIGAQPTPETSASPVNPAPTIASSTNTNTNTSATASTAGAGSGVANPFASDTASAAPARAPTPAPTPTDPSAVTNQVTRVGNSYSGSNVAGDISINGKPVGFGGTISAQNQAAAQALSDRSQARDAAPTGFAPAARMTASEAAGNFTVPGLQAKYDQLDLRDPSNIAARNARTGSTGLSNKRLAVENYAKAQAAQNTTAERGQDVTRDSALMQNETARRGQDVTAGTAQATNALAQQRIGMEGQELGIKQTAAGFTSRAAAQAEEARNAVINAKTPEEKAVATERWNLLNGKSQDAKDRYITTGAGQEWSPEGNAMRNVPARIFDTQTRQYVDQGDGQPSQSTKPVTKAEYDRLPKGAKYTSPNGSILIKG